jgi:serine/threonine protein kinase
MVDSDIMPVCSTCGTSYGSTVRICVRDGTPLVAGPADDPYLGTLLDGKYRIDSFINAGGMGSLYRALHVMLDKTVAVKVIKSELVTSDEIVARFLREARAASNLHHPNIVSVYDLGQTSGGTLYIAMEFIDGPSLKEQIRRNGPLTPRDSIDILHQVASALSAAHRKQIVHRDLKSDNLMLTSEDGRTVVKLVDFGIAKTFDESTQQLTAAGYMLGTPNYMSPEQAAGTPVDHRADLYSLGVILYEMLTGKVPFSDTALPTMLVRLATEVPPPPSSRRPDGHVPPALDAIAMRCLEKDPALRFQSASEFMEALERASADIDRTPATPAAPIATAAETVVVPTHGRRVPTPPPIPPSNARPMPTVPTHIPTPIPTPIPAPATDRGMPAPAAAVRDGLDMWTLVKRIAIGVLVLGAIVDAVVFGLRWIRNSQEETRASATIQQPATSSVSERSPSQPAAPVTTHAPAAPAPEPVTATPVAVQPPLAPEPSAPSKSAPPPQSASAAKPHAPSVAPLPVAPATSRPQASVDQTPAAAPAPVTAPAPVSTAPTQPPASAPSVALVCQTHPDDCAVIRTEIVRALRENQIGADVEITISMAVMFERPSTWLGVPSSVRTYAVQLTGTSRGTALTMPAKDVFDIDAFDRRTLEYHARQIASATVEAVRRGRK